MTEGAIIADSMPRHIAIIMDGNGRWAEARSLPRIAGHKKGADAARAVIEGCVEFGVPYLTLYAFSSENWSRPETEVRDLMELLRFYLGKELKSLHKQGVRLRFIGERERLAADIREKLEEAERLTKENQRLNLTVGISYGARQEILRAVAKLIEDARKGELTAEEVTEEKLEAALDTAGIPDPDLLVRTGGEQRLSNFLLWQMAYAEFYFTEVLWPDFGRDELAEAIQEFSRRERRYGKTREQAA